MLEIRPFQHLGQFCNDWLNSRYHFSFADYHHDARMGCGALRVWNDDSIQPGTGFNPHSHRDMEIVTYVRQGAVTHHDSLGNVGRIAAGQVQVISAGRGITHAEYNREDQITTLFQIWLLPRQRGLPARWETRQIPRLPGLLQLLASGLPEDTDVPHINSDARVWAGQLDRGDQMTHCLRPHGMQDGLAYMVCAQGSIRVNNQMIQAGDGLLISNEPTLFLQTTEGAELVMVELTGESGR